jgi:hypothetical protein
LPDIDYELDNAMASLESTKQDAIKSITQEAERCKDMLRLVRSAREDLRKSVTALDAAAIGVTTLTIRDHGPPFSGFELTDGMMRSQWCALIRTLKPGKKYRAVVIFTEDTE